MNSINQYSISSSDTFSNRFEDTTIPTDSFHSIEEIFREFLPGVPLNIAGECDEPSILGDEILSDSPNSTSIDAANVQILADELRLSTEFLNYQSNSADAIDSIRSDVRFSEERELFYVGAITNHDELVNKPDRDYGFVTLSHSVDISAPTHFVRPSHKINIKNELEETYRGRYKSDYFGMNGKNRKPRYVADRSGNHFITLEVPRNTGGWIRVDWLTIQNDSGEVFMMPYKFQQNNESKAHEDENPIYIPIDHDSKGIMKIYLVLIKATQSELRSAQPLKRFRPWEEAFGIADDDSSRKPSPTLNAKQLIKKYQLDQSQLAFTFCSIADDGISIIPEWDTTVYSTVLKETMTDATQKRKVVECPQCSTLVSTSFDEEFPAVKRKRSSSSKVSLPVAWDEIGIEDILPALL